MTPPVVDGFEAVREGLLDYELDLIVLRDELAAIEADRQAANEWWAVHEAEEERYYFRSELERITA